jgi:hypothetical protein
MQNISGGKVGAIFLKLFLIFFAVVFVPYPFLGQTFTENFENGILDEYWAFEGHHNTVSTNYATSGSKSYRSYLPAQKYSNARSEIRFRGANGVAHFQPNGKTFGARFAIYFPEDFQPDETSSEIIAQYHSVPDPQDTYSSPPWALRLTGRTISVTNRWISKRIASNNDQREKHWTLSEKIVPGRWHYFVVDIHWDYNPDGDGFMKFYMKIGAPPTAADIKIDHDGPTGYNDKLGAYFKIGIYKWDWKHQDRVNASKRAGVTERLLYFDEVSVKNNGFLNNTAPRANQKPRANAGEDLDVILDTQTEITLNGRASDPDGTVVAYRWEQISGPNDLTLSNQDAAKVSLEDLEEGTYILRLIVTDDEGATDSDDVRLSVKSNLNHAPEANAGPNITLVLPENSVELKGTTSDPDDGDSIESTIWIQSDGPTDVEIQNPEQLNVKIENLVPGRYVFKLKAYDQSGAEGYDHISIFVLRPEDLPNIAAEVNNASCNGSDGSVKLTVSGGSSPYTYQWSNGDNSRDLINVPRGEYDVIVTGSDGWSSSKTIFVGGATSKLSVEAEIDDAHCGKNDGSIQLQVKGGKAPYQFAWNTDQARTSGLNNLSAGTYKVSITDANGCSKKFSFTVDIAPGPIEMDVETTIENASCAGNDGIIQLVVLGEHGPYKYQWSNGGKGPRLNGLEEVVYAVKITDIHGCYSKKTFTVNQDPGLAKPQIMQSDNSLFIEEIVASYQWFKDGEIIEGATSQVLEIKAPGSYSVQIYNKQGCSTSSDNFEASDPRPFARSLDPSLTFQQFEFYPNPVIVDMQVEMAVSQPTTILLEVYDFNGNKIQSKSLGMVYSQTKEKLEVESYPPGVYLLRAKAGDEIITRRFVKP